MQLCGLVIFMKVPDRKANFGDVVLGYDYLADYIKDSPYFGAMIGRYGNRIAKGQVHARRPGMQPSDQTAPTALARRPQGFRQGGLGTPVPGEPERSVVGGLSM